MRKARILWRLVLSYCLLILLTLMAITGYVDNFLQHFLSGEIEKQLEIIADQAEKQIHDFIPLSDSQRIEELCRDLSRITHARITVILASGKVLGESTQDPQTMKSHSDRPEIESALTGTVGRSQRWSGTLQKMMVYVAVPMRTKENDIAGVVRASIPVTSVEEALHAIYWRIGFAGAAIAAAAAVVCWLIARSISRPLEEMKQVAEWFAQGKLGYRLPVSDTPEIGRLAEAMNQMAAQLDDRIRALVRQKNEQEAILAGMVEGVLAIDTEERIISLNQAAAQLFEIKPPSVEGKLIQELIRNPDLHRFIRNTLTAEEPVEGDITLHKPEDRFLQAHGTPLRGAKGERIGSVIVLNDVTRIRRLEDLRREFVANVSHELKTPITSIKGFVETLQEGALSDSEDARRFLGIIAKHTDRLNAIIEDLLSLSRLEQNGDKNRIPLEESSIKNTIQSVLEFCADKAAEKNIRIHSHCDERITAKINPPLLEQALVNLIDNAIKFSEPDTDIHIEVGESEEQIRIDVRDQGCGIEKEHLSRIFERFYRVDKARSRKLGGTGLGLSIVKHIAKVHGGQVTVESTPRQGSTFSLLLPRISGKLIEI